MYPYNARLWGELMACYAWWGTNPSKPLRVPSINRLLCEKFIEDRPFTQHQNQIFLHATRAQNFNLEPYTVYKPENGNRTISKNDRLNELPIRDKPAPTGESLFFSNFALTWHKAQFYLTLWVCLVAAHITPRYEAIKSVGYTTSQLFYVQLISGLLVKVDLLKPDVPATLPATYWIRPSPTRPRPCHWQYTEPCPIPCRTTDRYRQGDAESENAIR